jgi:hypothetical protein
VVSAGKPRQVGTRGHQQRELWTKGDRGESALSCDQWSSHRYDRRQGFVVLLPGGSSTTKVGELLSTDELG